MSHQNQVEITNIQPVNILVPINTLPTVATKCSMDWQYYITDPASQGIGLAVWRFCCAHGLQSLCDINLSRDDYNISGAAVYLPANCSCHFAQVLLESDGTKIFCKSSGHESSVSNFFVFDHLFRHAESLPAAGNL